jgi:hypothetical protein
MGASVTPLDTPPQHVTDRTARIVVPSPQKDSGSEPGKPRVIKLQIESPAARWFRDAVAEVEDLTTLAGDWNTYGASPVDATAATQAVRFLVDTAYSDLARPAIVPLSEGGIQIEWHRGGIDLEISFSDVEPGVYFEDVTSGASEEAPLSRARSYVLGNLERLKQ